MANTTISSAQTTAGPSTGVAITGPCVLKFSGTFGVASIGMSQADSAYVESGIVMTAPGMVYLNCPGTYYLNCTLSGLYGAASVGTASVTVVAIQ